MNTEYYENLRAAIDSVPVPDVDAMANMSSEALSEVSNLITEKLTSLSNTCNQALSGVTEKACDQLKLLAPLISPPSEIEDVISWLSDLADIIKKPYDDILGEITELIPMAITISTELAAKLSEINSAMEKAQALIDSDPSIHSFVIPLPTAPTVELIADCVGL